MFVTGASSVVNLSAEYLWNNNLTLYNKPQQIMFR